MPHVPADDRYGRMHYRRSGRSGLLLPAISLGLWWNFGHDRPLETSRAIVRRAFDLGVTHFDLANNYGPPYGSAEENFGVLLAQDLAPLPRRARHLDEGRLRHVARTVRRPRLAQVPPREPRPEPRADEARLRRHLLLAPLRPRHAARGDDRRARHGRSRRARRCTPGISSYSAEKTREAAAILRDLGTPLLIHQPSYSMLNRWIEPELLDAIEELGVDSELSPVSVMRRGIVRTSSRRKAIPCLAALKVREAGRGGAHQSRMERLTFGLGLLCSGSGDVSSGPAGGGTCTHLSSCSPASRSCCATGACAPRPRGCRRG